MKTKKSAEVKSKSKKEFVVDRQCWFRGLSWYAAPAALQTANGLRCCLGFMSLACGAKVKDIIGISMPQALPPRVKLIEPELRNPDGDSMPYDAADLNDDEGITEEVREAKLTKLFAKHGWEVKFVGSRKLPKKLAELKAKKLKSLSEWGTT